MMYMTKLINSPYTRLIVGSFYDDALDIMTPDRQVLRISRYLVETPVLCCSVCGKAARRLIDKHTKKEYGECPDHARHMYESYYQMSHDIKKYNNATRRKAHNEAGKWLIIWKRRHTAQRHEKAICTSPKEYVPAEFS